MYVITAKNVNEAVYKGLDYLLKEGVRSTSRNGTVLMAPMPVTTVYQNPMQRVLLCPERDANPFFHLMEAMWMLFGANDLATPQRYNQRFSEYSDDGLRIWGAYGWRWRSFFGYDQLHAVVQELRERPDSRRCVVGMWNPAINVDGDFGPLEPPAGPYPNDLSVANHGGRDVPCNTHVYVDTYDGRLNITVCCRSNDVIWGAYGANVVHMSILQEYLAAKVGVPVGVYRQVSNNYHAYTDVYSEDKLSDIRSACLFDTYEYRGYEPTVLVDPDYIESDLMVLHTHCVEDWPSMVNSKSFQEVVVPMAVAHHTHKLGRTQEAVELLEVARNNTNSDWLTAGREWLMRRLARETV